MNCENVMHVVFFTIFLIFPLHAFEGEYQSSSTPDFNSLLSPSLDGLFDGTPPIEEQETYEEKALLPKSPLIQQDYTSTRALHEFANSPASNNTHQMSPQAKDSLLEKYLIKQQSPSYEQFKSGTIRLLTHGYQIVSLKKSIFALNEQLYPGICADVIDTIQEHALSLTNQADTAHFEVMVTLLKLHALEQKITLDPHDDRDPCKGVQICPSQLHMQALNTSSAASDLFFAHDDFAFNELSLGILYGMFHESMIERLAHRFVSQKFTKCMECIDQHIVDTQKRQILLNYYPKIQIESEYAQNRRIISSKLHTWALAMPHAVSSELIEQLDRDSQTHYQTPDRCETPCVINAIDDHNDNQGFAINQALDDPIGSILNGIAHCAFTHSARDVHTELLNRLNDYPAKVADYILSVLCFKQTQSPILHTHASPCAHHSPSAHNGARIDLTYDSGSESTSENNTSEDYSERTSSDSYEEDEETPHYNTDSPQHIANSPALPAGLSALLFGKKISMKKITDRVEQGTFHEAIVVEAAKRATDYPAFCRFVKAVSNNISDQQFASSCAYYKSYICAVKAGEISPIQHHKIATRLENFHKSKYEKLKPHTPLTGELKPSSRKRKHSYEFNFIYKNGAITNNTKQPNHFPYI